MRLHKSLAAAVISCSLLGASSAYADKGLAERCIALKARLAKLDCREGLYEIQLLLADNSDIFKHFQSHLKRDRGGVVALAAVIDASSELAQHCLIKHASEKRPFDKAYLALVELHADMERWMKHKWEMPAEIQARSDQQTAEKLEKALGTLVSVSKTW